MEPASVSDIGTFYLSAVSHNAVGTDVAATAYQYVIADHCIRANVRRSSYYSIFQHPDVISYYHLTLDGSFIRDSSGG